MKKNTKILVLILSLALIIASMVAVIASADAADPSVEIVSKNLSYEDNIRILFAVKSSNIGNAVVKLNVYESDPKDNPDLAPAETVSPAFNGEIGSYGVCDVFFTKGIAAKFLSKQIYAQAVVTVGGVTYKSDVERYSIVEYCHEMIAKESTDAAKDAKYMDVIQYGASIQSFLADDGKYDGALATDYKYVTIEGGTLDGRYDSGIYLKNATLNPTVAGATKLVTDSGDVVNNGADFVVGDTNVSFAKADEKALATETFEGGALPSNISFVDTLPKIGNLGNSYGTSAYAVGKFENNTTNTTKCLFTSNKYAQSKAIIQIAESAVAEVGADMVEFEADLCLDWNTNGDNCEFFNLVLTDKDGNAAYNLVLRNMINGNRIVLLNRNTDGSMGAKGTQTLLMNADNVWFNLRVTYKYVNASEIAVEIFLNGNSIRTETIPATAGGAITLDNLVNAYIVINGNNGGGAHAINSYVAIDNVVFRKIAE